MLIDTLKELINLNDIEYVFTMSFGKSFLLIKSDVLNYLKNNEIWNFNSPLYIKTNQDLTFVLKHGFYKYSKYNFEVTKPNVGISLRMLSAE